MLQSVSLFFLFKPINCDPVFSRLSKAALTCYIIHCPFLYYLRIEYFIHQPTYILAMQIIGSLVVIYLLAYVFMTVYDFFFKKLQGKLNNITMDYQFDN